MWAGDGAALSHRAAALAWRLDPIQNKIIELTSPRDLRHAPKGIIVHIARLGGRDVGRLDSLRVTSPARTLVDLSSVVDEEALEIALDCALCRRMAAVERIQRCLDEVGRQGRNGSAGLSRLLELRVVGTPLGMSPLEIRFLRLLRKARVAHPEPQYQVMAGGRRYVIDYAYPDERVAVELDGYRWHSSPDRLVSDRRKSNAVVLAGWSLLRFTDADVKTRSDEVVAAVLAARGHRKLWDIAPL
jgi:very-short-patch-repair endonuclease